MLYLKSAVSKAMSESTDAISQGLVIPYRLNAAMSGAAAWLAVAHSLAAGGLVQLEEVGAMARS